MNSNSFELKHGSIVLELLKEKVVWANELKTIFIADLHYGKAAHFRKSGIPVPEPIHNSDLLTIASLIETYSPRNIYFLGDLFHSDWNDQWDVLINFFESYPNVQFHLIKGNHDILSPQFYMNSSCIIHDAPVEIENLYLSHEPSNEVLEGKLNLCGHIHPGIRIRGKAKQSIRLACFFRTKHQLILPAFGNFTGLALIRPKTGDEVFAITPNRVLSIQS